LDVNSRSSEFHAKGLCDNFGLEMARKLTKKFFQEQGSLGGKKTWAGKTAAQKKATASHASHAYWDSLTPEQRSAEMKRRAKKRKK
jgi:hypothetical protein